MFMHAMKMTQNISGNCKGTCHRVRKMSNHSRAPTRDLPTTVPKFYWLSYPADCYTFPCLMGFFLNLQVLSRPAESIKKSLSRPGYDGDLGNHPKTPGPDQLGWKTYFSYSFMLADAVLNPNRPSNVTGWEKCRTVLGLKTGTFRLQFQCTTNWAIWPTQSDIDWPNLD